MALFQHFSMTAVIEHQLARSGGSLRVSNLLTGLAGQFGRATGRPGALRYALEMMMQEETAGAGAQGGAKPSVHRLGDTTEPHARGQFLVAAIFDAFVTIYERRTADLFAIAQRVPGEGALIAPELVRRLAREASSAADQVLRMCVRALDYLPPVDFTFGEYLRAIVTADADLVPNDPLNYRVAFADAFRRRGIMVPGCMSYAPDSLIWEEPDFGPLLAEHAAGDGGLFRDLMEKLEVTRSLDFRRINLRDEAMRIVEKNQAAFHGWLVGPAEGRTGPARDREWERLFGIRYVDYPTGLHSVRGRGRKPSVEVAFVRVARRTGPDGTELHQLVVRLVQRRRGYLDPHDQAKADKGSYKKSLPGWTDPDFWFLGGATLLIDLRTGQLRRMIRKRIDDDGRLEDQRRYHTDDPFGLAVARSALAGHRAEPFALMHRSV